VPSHVLAAVLYLDIAGKALVRKEMAETLKLRGARVMQGEEGAIVAIFTNGDAAPSACVQAAIDGLQAARKLGVSAHAGASCGALKVDDSSGGALLEGACVTMAARLHKLEPESTGRLLLDAATKDYLALGLRSLCRPMGSRDLDGAGATEVFSLAWDEEKPRPVLANGTLEVAIGRIRHVFKPGDADKDARIGRSASRCILVVPADIVSGEHLELSHESGRWYLVDKSRHGTWVRGTEPGSEVLVHGAHVPLGPKGAMCLGRKFADDPQGATTIEFEQAV
jgi:hypothetical protein